jgi:hypothetical protein
LGRFKTDPVRITLPKDIPDEFKTHISNLTRTYEREKENKKDKEGSSIALFVNTGPDHYAHCLTYCELALQFAPSAGNQNLGKVL